MTASKKSKYMVLVEKWANLMVYAASINKFENSGRSGP